MEQHSFPMEVDGKRVEIIDKRYINGVMVLTDEDGNQYTPEGVNATPAELDKDKLPEGGYSQTDPNITTADSERGLAVTPDGETHEVNIPVQEALNSIPGQSAIAVNKDGETEIVEN